MDYMWALTFIMISWYLILKNKYLMAGLMMGLAISSRPTSLFLMIPFLYLVYNDANPKKNIFKFTFLAFLTSILLFLPLYLEYGLSFLTYYPFSISWMTVWSDASYYFGSIAIIVGIILIFYNLKNLYNKIVLEKDKMFIFLVISIFFIILPFIKAPYEIAYLIPAIPFVLLLLNGISKKKFFVIFCILLLLNSFISLNVTSSKNFIQNGVDDGLINSEINLQKNIVFNLKKIINSDINNSVIIYGEYLPFITYLYENSGEPIQPINMVGSGKLENNEYLIKKKNLRYVYLISLNDVLNFKKKKYKIYFVGNTTKNITKTEFGYDLTDYGCENIFRYLYK
ncbi:MAG: hypothetical protein QME14_01315 [Methanobacteriaceae archaeon]|nr:hypothetical protein [Methanobacteriaceae archaeon]